MTQIEDSQTQPSSAGHSPSLWQAFASGVRNNLAAEVVVQVVRVGGTVVLAHKLAPGNFGLMKVLLIVSMFAVLFCESGLPDALIQRKDLTLEHETTAWWLSLGMVASTIAVLYVAAPLIERAMATKGLATGIRLLCLPLFLEGTAIVPVARLSRSLKFSALALADVAAEFAFLSVAFGLIWVGRPEWSLVGGLVGRFAVHAAMVWAADPHIPIGLPRLAAARDLGGFALSVLGGRVVTIASGNADFLLVGRILGATALGYYSMAWDLLRFVPDRLHRVIGRVALPAFCRLRDDNGELGNAYCGLTHSLARLVLPLAGGIAVAAPVLVTTIYGRQWLPAASPMRLLAIGLALSGLRIANAPVYYAKNYPAMDIFLNGGRLILIVLAVISTARTGLLGVSASVGAVEALVSVAGQYAVCVLIGLGSRNLIAAIFPSVRVTGICVLATIFGVALVAAAGLPRSVALLGIATPPALAFLWLEGAQLRQLLTGTMSQMTIRPAEAQN
jgi:O-antigen/teichoic acid export membrane protein